MQGLLWLACQAESLVATYEPVDGKCTLRLSQGDPVNDICPTDEGLWLVTGGGKPGRRLILWSLEKNEAIRRFDCPDGAASGITHHGGKLWLAHRRKRKLFCLDPCDGSIRWVISTRKEIFSPSTFGNELWLVECDPGPLGDWSHREQAAYFFIRYDTARERVADRISVPSVPRCMAFDGERFWYAEEEKKGFSWVSRKTLVLPPLRV